MCFYVVIYKGIFWRCMFESESHVQYTNLHFICTYCIIHYNSEICWVCKGKWYECPSKAAKEGRGSGSGRSQAWGWCEFSPLRDVHVKPWDAISTTPKNSEWDGAAKHSNNDNNKSKHITMFGLQKNVSKVHEAIASQCFSCPPSVHRAKTASVH